MQKSRLSSVAAASYSTRMNTLAQLEAAVRQLSDADRLAFRAWYAEYDAEEWDREFEADADAGKLNWLIEEARRDNREGRCTDR